MHTHKNGPIGIHSELFLVKPIPFKFAPNPLRDCDQHFENLCPKIIKFRLVGHLIARLPTAAICEDHMKPLLKDLYFLPTAYWAHFMKLTLTLSFKAFNGLKPDCMRKALPFLL